MKKFIKNKVKVFAVLMVVILSINDMLAQQDPEYTHYMFNGLALNPAYAGSRDAISGVALYRIQWVDVDKAPRTLSVSGHTPIGKTNNNVGLSIVSDILGVHNNLWINADYAYRMKLETGKLALGIRAQILNRSADFTNVITVNPDNAFIGQNISETEFDVGLGAWYSSKTFYLGASMPHLLNQKELLGGSLDNKQVNHFFLTAGYVVPITSQIKLKPSLLFKVAPNSPLQVDFNALALFMDQFWVGLGYRTGDSVNFIFDAEVVDNFRLGYSYDLTVHKDWGGTVNSRRINTGSHEIMVAYDFVPENTKVLTPRYF